MPVLACSRPPVLFGLIDKPGRVVDILDKLLQFCPLRLADWSRLLIAACKVDIHEVGHLDCSQRKWGGVVAGLLTGKER